MKDWVSRIHHAMHRGEAALFSIQIMFSYYLYPNFTLTISKLFVWVLRAKIRHVFVMFCHLCLVMPFYTDLYKGLYACLWSWIFYNKTT